MIWLAIALGGALGAMLRWAVERWTVRRYGTGFPRGTVVVNLAGSLILGIVAGAALNSRATSFLGTGFCGALTTFSGFAAQGLDLSTGKSAKGSGYLLVSTVAGVVLAACGIAIGRAL